MEEQPRIRRVSAEVRRAARQLRREETEAEAVLWAALRGGRIAGLKFRRQHAVGRFVLDFYCPAHKLVVEVDGGIHDAQSERDSARSAALEAHGYTVLRFRNKEVLNTLPEVLARIRRATQGSFPPLPELGEGARG